MRPAERTRAGLLRKIGLGIGAASLLALPLAAEIRLKRPAQPLTEAWRRVPVEPRGSTRLGISFRPRQVAAFGLDARSTLRDLLAYPFELIRLGAYWKGIEPTPGAFDTRELDWQVEAAERSGKQIVLCVGAVKTFGYPEFFVPDHHLARRLPEHALVEPSGHASLLAAAIGFLTRVIDRYRDRESIVAWQVEHEAVDPLGLEHSWRLDAAFVELEVAAARGGDPSRPILLNGFLPASLPVRLSQWWRTRDQGDSLALAGRLADIVGVDHYPRHALAAVGARTLYLDGSRSPWQGSGRRRLFARARRDGRRLMVSEGQAEPWETATPPPAPRARGMSSCLPEHVIENYNRWMSWSRREAFPLDAYLFWGAEYWMLRQQRGDPRYAGAFARVVEPA